MTQNNSSADQQFNHQNGHGFRNRGRGPRTRGHSRGNRGGGDRFHPPSNSVPPSRQVIPGAGVSIVLKVDQATGREVQGIVQDVLTSGDHPRGVKVRLQDGRVGRVQRIVDDTTARTASEGLTNLGRNGEPAGVVDISHTSHRGQPFTQSRRQFSDVRDDPYDYDSQSRAPPSLADYIRGSGFEDDPESNAAYTPEPEHHSSNGPQFITPTTICPVCGIFEGDEAAVAFHANSHFD